MFEILWLLVTLQVSKYGKPRPLPPLAWWFNHLNQPFYPSWEILIPVDPLNNLSHVLVISLGAGKVGGGGGGEFAEGRMRKKWNAKNVHIFSKSKICTLLNLIRLGQRWLLQIEKYFFHNVVRVFFHYVINYFKLFQNCLLRTRKTLSETRFEESRKREAKGERGVSNKRYDQSTKKNEKLNNWKVIKIIKYIGKVGWEDDWMERMGKIYMNLEKFNLKIYWWLSFFFLLKITKPLHDDLFMPAEVTVSGVTV